MASCSHPQDAEIKPAPRRSRRRPSVRSANRKSRVRSSHRHPKCRSWDHSSWWSTSVIQNKTYVPGTRYNNLSVQFGCAVSVHPTGCTDFFRFRTPNRVHRISSLVRVVASSFIKPDFVLIYNLNRLSGQQFAASCYSSRRKSAINSISSSGSNLDITYIRRGSLSCSDST